MQKLKGKEVNNNEILCDLSQGTKQYLDEF